MALRAVTTAFLAVSLVVVQVQGVSRDLSEKRASVIRRNSVAAMYYFVTKQNESDYMCGAGGGGSDSDADQGHDHAQVRVNCYLSLEDGTPIGYIDGYGEVVQEHDGKDHHVEYPVITAMAEEVGAIAGAGIGYFARQIARSVVSSYSALSPYYFWGNAVKIAGPWAGAIVGVGVAAQ
jgi:hypothetical protein